MKHAKQLLSVEFNRIIKLLGRADLREGDKKDWLKRLEETQLALITLNKAA